MGTRHLLAHSRRTLDTEVSQAWGLRRRRECQRKPIVQRPRVTFLKILPDNIY